MARERLAMRKIHEVLRLRFECHKTNREIAKSANCSASTVSGYLSRALVVGIHSYDQIKDIDDTEIERRLGFSRPYVEQLPKGLDRPLPDFQKVHQELRRCGVTLQLLWEEYREVYPLGYKYTQFCEYHRRWKKKLSLVMRQIHKAGEKCFVDYSGDSLFVTSPVTGEKIPTELFVGALGASSYTYAEATFSQALPDWLMSHVRMFEFFGGVSELTIPDNLLSGVSHACFYDPEINPSYQDLAEHYATCILPARVRKARDKAKAEVAVQVAQRWILAVLRDRTFYSLAELNAAIRELLQKLNNRVMRHLGKSRKELFENLDRPALKPLPSTRYEFAEWKKAKVNIDYHIRFDDHHYSAPYTLVHEQVRIRANATTVEIFFKGKRITSHLRSCAKGKYTTKKEHMPKSHLAHAEWTPSRMIGWGQKIGPGVGALIRAILKEQIHPEWGYRGCLGIIRLSKTYGEDRLEKAANKALAMKSPHYRTVKTMLKTNMESVPLEQTCKRALSKKQLTLFVNENVRGKDYYH